MQYIKNNSLHVFLVFIQLIIFISVGFYFVWNKPLSFDESYNLQVPSNLINSGEYSSSHDGGMSFEPEITTGPTVLLPIGIVFHLFGIGIFQARIIMLAYFFLLIVSINILSYRLYGIKSAVLSSILIFILPDTFIFGSLVLGEIPALFFFIFGLILFLAGKPTASGLFFGLAILTKNIFALLIITLILLWSIDTLVTRYLGTTNNHLFFVKLFSGLTITILAWEIVKITSVGWIEYKRIVEKSLLVYSGPAGLKISIPLIIQRNKILGQPFDNISPEITTIFIILFILHNLIMLFFDLKKTKVWLHKERIEILLILFSLSGLFWFFFGSHANYWRYLYPIYICIILLIGNSFSSITDLTIYSAKKLFKTKKIKTIPNLFAMSVLSTILLIYMIIYPAIDRGKYLAKIHKSKIQKSKYEDQIRISNKISSIIEKGGVITYWGWWQSPEISFLTQERFWNIHNPSTRETMDRLSKQGEDVFVLISPIQMELDPQIWTEESKFTGNLEFEDAGYQLFEYVPIDD